MNIFYTKLRTIFFLCLYLFLYISPALENPFIAINLLETLVVVVISSISFLLTYLLSTNYFASISSKVKSNFQIVIVIILGYLLFFRPLSFSKIFNYYPNRILSICIILIWIVFIIYLAKKNKINYILPIIIFLPSLLKAILMSNSVTSILYFKIPDLNTIIILISLIVYQRTQKRR